MKKKIVISGSLQDMVKYCTAMYDMEGDFNTESLTEIISSGPIFEDKNFYTNILGMVSKTTVSRKAKMFIRENIITLQLRYEILKVVDIELSPKDEAWIDSDIKKLIEHFELLLNPFAE